MRRRKIWFGPPGTGKTTMMMRIMEEALARKVPPDRIAVISFTKKAAEEAKTRAKEKFNLDDDDLPWFRTVHSLVFRRMGYRRQQVVKWKDFLELGSKIGVEFNGTTWSDDGMVTGLGVGDKLVFLENLSRVTNTPLQKIWEDSDHGTEWMELEMFKRAYATFKRGRELVDYTDMLERFIEEKPAPPIDVLIVDEAQDLSWMQWRVVDILSENAKEVHIAGDDDQAIYRWAGADVDHFINLDGDITVLEQSHRISNAIHQLAAKISGSIQNRKEKVFKPRQSPGKVDFVGELDEADLGQGTWLLLARNTYMLRKLEEHCRNYSFSYSAHGKSPADSPAVKAIMVWETLRAGKATTVDKFLQAAQFMDGIGKKGRADLGRLDPESAITFDQLQKSYQLTETRPWYDALNKIQVQDREYFRAARRRGEKLLAEPRIKISTIHGVKGGQADNVLLLTDMSKATHEAMQRNYDDEARVFYVGVTRARETLNVVMPRTNLCFEM